MLLDKRGREGSTGAGFWQVGAGPGPGPGKVRAALESWWVTLEYSKGGDLRFLSHLDLMRLWERALRRSGLPLCWKGKFNPRPRFSMGPALPLGFASESEVLAVSLARPVPPREVREKLGPQLPADVGLHRVFPGKKLPGPSARILWKVFPGKPLPPPEALEKARNRLQGVTDRRGRALDAGKALVDMRIEGETLLVLLAPLEGRRLGPDLLARALGLGRPRRIVKLALIHGPTDQDTKEFHVEKNPDQRSGSGGTPDRGGGERSSPGDPHRQPQP
ncbi:MAG TPA: DUF2344 domain-containing protein [Planctomycetes bacterium]|nr:DUF2344 domain-containing protein [Planctomycetota bacterium]